MTTKDYLNGYKLARADSPNSIKRRRVVKNPPWFNDEIQLVFNKKYKLFEKLFNNGKLQSIYDRLQCITTFAIASLFIG